MYTTLGIWISTVSLRSRGGEGLKIFFVILALFALLIFAVSQTIGLE